MGRVDGKVVVITGAAGGQGAAEVELLAAEGATVIATDLEAPPGGRRLDVTSADDWAALAARLTAEHGRVDGLVNNAGIAMRDRLEDLAIEDLERVLAVNVGGCLRAIQALLPLMGRGASIVNIGSIGGTGGYHAVGYAVSKWGLRGLSRSASMELGPRGIRVNTVLPGFIETPMTAAAPPAFRTANIEATPLGRTGEAHEVAQLVLFLLSDESSFISGAELVIDGGQTGHGGAKHLSDAVRRATQTEEGGDAES